MRRRSFAESDSPSPSLLLALHPNLRLSVRPDLHLNPFSNPLWVRLQIRIGTGVRVSVFLFFLFALGEEVSKYRRLVRERPW